MNRFVKIRLGKMICGLKWWIYISYNNAYRIARELRLKVIKDYVTKRECLVDDQPKTWRKTGKYKNLHIEIEKFGDGRYKLTVRGSLHKFFHGNNSGTFTGNEVLCALNKLQELFQIGLSESTIVNLEVGINLPVWFVVYLYLSNNLLYHKKKSKTELEPKGVGFLFMHEDYYLKIYQKEKHILRFELKYLTKEKLSAFGIKSLADLNENSINRLVCSLVPEWNEILMRGGLNLVDKRNNPDQLTPTERERLLEFTSEGYLQSYKEELKKALHQNNRQRSGALRMKAIRLRKFCAGIIEQRGDGVHKKLGEMIASGVEEFMNGWAA